MWFVLIISRIFPCTLCDQIITKVPVNLLRNNAFAKVFVFFKFLVYYPSKMSVPVRDTPWCLSLIEWISSKCCPQRGLNRLAWHQGGILALTYIAYTCYHLTRKPISVVKNVLNRNCSILVPPPDIIINDTNRYNWCDWPPFGKQINCNINMSESTPLGRNKILFFCST